MANEKLNNCPIIETVFEIKFNNEKADNDPFGAVNEIVNALNMNNEPIKSEIYNLPYEYILSNPEIINAPFCEIKNDAYLIKIGPKLIAISLTSNYTNWESFSEIIIKIMTSLNNVILFEKMKRIALRYINFFENINIFEKVKVSINNKISDVELFDLLNNSQDMFLRKKIKMTIEETMIENNIVLSNTINFNNTNGSIFDIDSFVIMPVIKEFDELKVLLNKIHDSEYKIFSKILTEEFLKELKG